MLCAQKFLKTAYQSQPHLEIPPTLMPITARRAGRYSEIMHCALNKMHCALNEMLIKKKNGDIIVAVHFFCCNFVSW